MVKDFPGNYSDYRKWKQETEEEARTPKPGTPAPDSGTKQRPTVNRQANKLTFKEKKEFEALEEVIASLTAEKESLEAEFASGAAVADIASKSERYTALKSLLDEKELRWLELSEKL